MYIKFPEIPLDMSVCDGSDNEDLEHVELKQEPMDSDKVKSEEFQPGLEMLESGDPHSDSKHILADAQFETVTDSGKLYVMEFILSEEQKLGFWVIHVYIILYMYMSVYIVYRFCYPDREIL